jgi:hypothetical protein
MNPNQNPMKNWLDRRGFMGDVAAGIIGVALMDLDKAHASQNQTPGTANSWQPGQPQFEPKARHKVDLATEGRDAFLVWGHI